MAGKWKVSSPIGPPGTPKAPVVSLRRTAVRIEEIHFATPATGSSDFHYLYYSSDTHPIAPAPIHWWGRGSKITEPEWADNGRRNLRACFTRKKPVAMRVKLIAQTTQDVSGDLTATPTLDGSTAHLTAASVSFTYPANAAEHWVIVQLGGVMPDEVGRYILRLRWDVSGSGFRFRGPLSTQHRIYGIYGRPMRPEYDSAAVGDTGVNTTVDEGTLTGTLKRLDHMMRGIGGNDRRHPAATQDDLVNLYWALHKAINDTPGAPPYFNADHNEHMTTPAGDQIPLEDQWLAWVANSSKWNDASCIGHVQVAKTMLAAVGLFARRTWVFPHTPRLPDGNTISFADEDLYCLGEHDEGKQQMWTFTHGSNSYDANPKLMEPGIAWENFEACMLTPTGKFLTGGYATSSNPPSFHRNKGFNSAAELLRWWSSTSRSGFGRRFMCWVYYDRSTNEGHCWDVDGTYYPIGDYVRIRERGKQLPPP